MGCLINLTLQAPVFARAQFPADQCRREAVMGEGREVAYFLCSLSHLDEALLRKPTISW